MVRADFAVALSEKFAQHLCRPRVGGHRVCDDVGGAHAVAREELMQAAQGVDVLEALIPSRLQVPLVVAFGVDGDEQGRTACRGHRS